MNNNNSNSARKRAYLYSSSLLMVTGSLLALGSSYNKVKADFKTSSADINSFIRTSAVYRSSPSTGNVTTPTLLSKQTNLVRPAASDAASITVHYVNQNGKEIPDRPPAIFLPSSSTDETFNIGSKMEPDSPGYLLSSIHQDSYDSSTLLEKDVPITFQDGNLDIYCVYQGQLMTDNIKINYLDQNNNAIIDEMGAPITENISGNLGDNYPLDPKLSFVGANGATYTFTFASNLKDGKPITNLESSTEIQIKEQVIDYHYQASAASGKINVHYVDQNGHELKSSTDQLTNNGIHSGSVGDYLDISQRPDVVNIDGLGSYTFNSVHKGRFDTFPTDINIPFSNQDQDVYYLYVGNGTPVNIHYVDQDGVPIPGKEVRTSTEKIGDSFVPSEGEMTVGINGKTANYIGMHTGSYDGPEVTTTGAQITNKLTDIYLVYNSVSRTTLITKYQDEAGNTIAPDTSVDNVFLGTIINQPIRLAPTITGYHAYKTLGNGTAVSVTNNSVTYVYKANDTLVPIQYIDQTGKSIKKSAYIIGKFNAAYNITGTDAPVIDNYTFKRVDNGSDKYSMSNKPIQYIYQGVDKDISIKYLDAEGNEIKPSETVTGSYNDDYNYYKKDAPEITGYKISTVTNGSGTFGKDATPVTFTYAPETSLTINYLDATTKQPIQTPTTTTGSIGDVYSFKAADHLVSGYTFERADPSDITLSGSQPNVINAYYKKQTGIITLHYVDETGAQIQDDQVVALALGTTFNYTTDQAEQIPGYEIKAVTSGTGTVGATGNTVTFIYKSKTLDPEINTNWLGLTTNYVDESGVPLRQSTIQSIAAGATYHTNSLNITGYHLVRTSGATNGTMVGPTSVTYIYAKDTTNTTNGTVNVTYTDAATGAAISNGQTITGEIGTTYTTTPAVISHYTLVATPKNAVGIYTTSQTTVNYQYRAKSAYVIIKYLDENGQTISKSTALTGKYGTSYKLSAADIPTIAGYTFKSINGATGVFDDTKTNVIEIYYRKNSNTNKNHQEKLPQTGNNQKEEFTTTFLGMMSTLIAVLGLWFVSKYRNKSQKNETTK